MSQRILLPFDGSLPALWAAPVAATMAKRRGWLLMLAVPSEDASELKCAIEQTRSLAEGVVIGGALVGVAGCGARFCRLLDEIQPAAVVVPYGFGAAPLLRAMVRTLNAQPPVCDVVVTLRDVEAREPSSAAQSLVRDRVLVGRTAPARFLSKRVRMPWLPGADARRAEN